MIKRHVVRFVMSAGLLGIAATSTLAQTSIENIGPVNRSSAPIKGQYIVVFKDTVKDPRAEVASLNRGGIMRVNHVYTSALKGFAAQIPDVVVNALRNNPRVNYIEQDQTVSVNGEQPSPPSWGLDRIDEAAIPLDGKYTYGFDGTGVTAYIIDTGIRATHSEFKTLIGSRVLPGFTAINDGRGTNDCDGHGTHVAGTVGGKNVGVAKNVNLVPVRVLNCRGSGTISGVIRGVDWVAAKATKPAVANMSLGGGTSTALDDSVNAAIGTGVAFAVAAGNSTADACNSSPARVGDAITVGATTSSDVRASYSNFGRCVDIFAPGSSIYSAYKNSDTSYGTLSGTSMASPHVAGAIALLLEESPLSSPSQIRSLLLADSPTIVGLNLADTQTQTYSNELLNVQTNKQ